MTPVRGSRRPQRQDSAITTLLGMTIYWAIVLVLALGVCTVLIVVVLPNFVLLFREFHADLPLPTRVVIAVGDFSQASRVEIVSTLAILLLAGLLISQSPRRRGDGLQGQEHGRADGPGSEVIILAAVVIAVSAAYMLWYGLLQTVR
jgi:hypothetical protein